MAETVQKTVEFQIEDMNAVINCLNDISIRGIDCIKFANVLHILQSKGTIK